MKRQKDLEKLIQKGKIFCTPDGKVFSGVTGKQRKIRFNNDYAALTLGPSKTKEGFFAYVHQIVFVFFNQGIDFKGREINHIDGNKENNHISNLELVSHAENLEHARKTGLIDRERVSPLTAEQVKEIKKLIASGQTCCSIAKKYDIKNTNVIYQIKRGRTWKDI